MKRRSKQIAWASVLVFLFLAGLICAVRWRQIALSDPAATVASWVLPNRQLVHYEITRSEYHRARFAEQAAHAKEKIDASAAGPRRQTLEKLHGMLTEQADMWQWRWEILQDSAAQGDYDEAARMLEYARQVEPIDIPKGPRPPTRPTWESEDVLSFVPKEMLPNEGQYDASVRDQMIGMEALPWASGRPVEPPFLGMCQVFILTGDVEIQRLRDELADME